MEVARSLIKELEKLKAAENAKYKQITPALIDSIENSDEGLKRTSLHSTCPIADCKKKIFTKRCSLCLTHALHLKKPQGRRNILCVGCDKNSMFCAVLLAFSCGCDEIYTKDCICPRPPENVCSGCKCRSI